MLNKDPTKRPKPEELLKHKWLQQKLVSTGTAQRRKADCQHCFF